MKALVTQAPEFTPDQLQLITSTVAKNATPDELKLFLYRCKILDLDPLKPGQIHFVKYGKNPGTIIVGIEGFRARAAKTGKHSGTKRGVLRDEKGKCVGAWCEVYRKDWQQPAREEVSLSEYNTNMHQWAKMPETMIKKVAEVAALRMAFPDELGGLYSHEEMDQAENATIPNPIRDLREEEKQTRLEPGEYVATFGKFKGRKLKDLDVYELNGYVNFIRAEAEARGKGIQGTVAAFLEHADQFLASREVGEETSFQDELTSEYKSHMRDVQLASKEEAL